jgi:hypothetical protein
LNRFDDVWVFVEIFGIHFNAIDAKTPERKQLIIVNVRLEIGYRRKGHLDIQINKIAERKFNE